jgi:DNA-binding NarL/FixJ family response regulator
MSRLRGAEAQADRPGLRGANTITIDNWVVFISQFASRGMSDPDIADTLGIKTSAVRTLRRREGIEPGEQRWIGGRTSG